MKLNIASLACFLPLLATACGHKQEYNLEIDADAGIAAPADANGTVRFTFLGMQDMNITSPAAEWPRPELQSPQVGASLGPGLQPSQVASSQGMGFVNYSADTSMRFIEDIAFTISSPGLPDATLASGAGPGEPMGGSFLDLNSKKDFGPYLRASAFSITASVRYTEAVATPDLTTIQIKMGVLPK